MRKPNSPARGKRPGRPSRRVHAPRTGRESGAAARKPASPFALLLLLGAGFLVLAGGLPAKGALSDYEPDIDVSAGTFNYLFNGGDGVPDFGTGVYFGGYLNMKSPLFTFFFNTKNVYSTYEAGFAYNRTGSGDSQLVSIPATVELSYRIPLFKRLSLHPFAGTGIDTVNKRDNGADDWSVYYLLDGGLEIKYRLWQDTFLKLKVTYGMIFVNDLPSGYAHYIRVRFPIPFIP